MSELVAELVMRSELGEAERVLEGMIGFVREWDRGLGFGCAEVGGEGGMGKKEEGVEDVFGPATPAPSKSILPSTSSQVTHPYPSTRKREYEGPFWKTYAPLLALHHAHLSHARGDAGRAVRCYALAARLSCEGGEEGGLLDVAAKAGDVLLRLGLLRTVSASSCCPSSFSTGTEEIDEDPQDGEENEMETEMERVEKELREDALEVAGECEGARMGGALECVGQVLRSAVCGNGEILRSK